MAGKADENIVLTRDWGSIAYAVRSSGSMPAKAFLEGLPRQERIKFEILFEYMASQGRIPNKEKFRKLRDQIWEFKSGQNRIACFQHSNVWFLTHGFVKKRGKTLR
jgi:hypothetical protein